MLLGIIGSLIVGAWPAIKTYGISFLWRTEWDPVQEQFGGLVMIWGTVPQLYVQSRRRSPIPWLMTNAQRMDLILPNWRDVMFESLEKTQPVFLVDFEGDVNLAEIKTKAGLTYQLDHRFGGDRYAIYRRK